MMRFIKPSLIICCAITLQSCFFVAGAAAGATVAIIYDQRSVDSMLEDKRIAGEIAGLIRENEQLKKSANISVTSFGGIVLLSGQTPTRNLKQAAEKIARSVSGVKRFYNGLTLEKPIPYLVRASDSWITTKIKTSLLAKTGLQSTSIKVVTENSTVYLLGSASKNQAESLIDFVNQISGVKQVIPILAIPTYPKTINSAQLKETTPETDAETPLIKDIPAEQESIST